MNKQEFATIVSIIRTFYAKENIIPNSQAVELWYQMLGDLDFKTAEIFIKKWVSTEKWSPSIADIRQGVAEISLGGIPDWSESYEKVRRAISSYGYMQYEEAVKEFDEPTKRTVERIGWRELCLSETDQGTKRAQYRDVYNGVVTQAKNERAIAPEVRALIESTIQKGNLLGNGKKVLLVKVEE